MKRKFLFTVIASLMLFIYLGCESSELQSAKIYAQQNDLEQAEEYFLKAMALESEAGNAEIPFLLASQVYARQYRYDEMIEMLDRAVSLDPNRKYEGSTIAELAQAVRETEGNRIFNQGVTAFNNVIRSSGEMTEEQQSQQLMQAKTQFETSIRIWPELDVAYSSLVYVCRQLGETEQELEVIEAALERFPESGQVLLLAGETAWTDGDTERALELYQRAYEIIPDDVGLMERLTAVYMELKEYDAALEVLETALETAPRDPNVNYNLGVVYNAIGGDAFELGQTQYNNAASTTPPSFEGLEAALDYFEQAQAAYTEALYYLDNSLAYNPDDASASSAVTQIQNMRRVLNTLIGSTEEIIEQRR